jgi:hypothetical protein
LRKSSGWRNQQSELEHYTSPIPALQRAVVEKLSRLVTNGDELPKFAGDVPEPFQQIQ